MIVDIFSCNICFISHPIQHITQFLHQLIMFHNFEYFTPTFIFLILLGTNGRHNCKKKFTYPIFSELCPLGNNSKFDTNPTVWNTSRLQYGIFFADFMWFIIDESVIFHLYVDGCNDVIPFSSLLIYSSIISLSSLSNASRNLILTLIVNWL